MTKDPICGMTVDEATALHAERDGETFYFCSEHCRKKFLSQSAPDDHGSHEHAHREEEHSCCGGHEHDGHAAHNTTSVYTPAAISNIRTA